MGNGAFFGGYFSGTFASRSTSSYAWTYLYGGYPLDLETLFYQVRNRYYHSALGRWLSRDPLGSTLEIDVSSDAVSSIKNQVRSILEIAGASGDALSALSSLDWLFVNLLNKQRNDVELTQGLNLYWYISNNAVNNVDPLGLEGESVAGAAGGAIAGAVHEGFVAKDAAETSACVVALALQSQALQAFENCIGAHPDCCDAESAKYETMQALVAKVC